MSTDEIRNGAFVYRDTLFAEVGEGKRHPRASASELRDLLLPKKNAVSAKDQVAHWYEAQLIHYGLPRVKDKNAAKVRLLGAINSGGLKVPGQVQQLEADLKKQYTSAQRKVKNSMKKAGNTDTVNAGKKRKANEMETSQNPGSTTKISFTVGDVTVDVNHNSVAQTAAIKRTKKTTAKSETKTVTSTTKKKTVAPKAKGEHASPLARKKATSSKPKTERSNTVSRSQYTAAVPPRPVSFSGTGIGNHARPKQTARRSRPFNYSAARNPPAHPSPPSLATDDEEPPPPYLEYRQYDDQDDDQESYSGNSDIGQVAQISGEYMIEISPSDESAELIVRVSHVRDQLWGRFAIASKTGIIRLDSIDDIAGSVRKSFSWRSEDSDTGQLRFGKGCDGWIEFNGGGGVRGAFHGLIGGRGVEFEGELQDHFGYEDNEEREEAIEFWTSEWHQYPERAYGRR